MFPKTVLGVATGLLVFFTIPLTMVFPLNQPLDNRPILPLIDPATVDFAASRYRYFPSKNFISTLDPSHVPSAHNPSQRIIVVGDVHGMLDPLKALLHKVHFDGGEDDHLVLAGDMVSKGPNSSEVLSLAQDVGAYAVRGNHEDRVLRGVARRVAAENGVSGWDEDGEEWKGGVGVYNEPDEVELMDILDGDAPAELLKSKKGKRKAGLSKKEVHWLAKLPLVLRLGHLPPMGEVVVVHAGLVPGIRLEHQNPWVVMNIRSLIKARRRHRKVHSNQETADDEYDEETEEEFLEEDDTLEELEQNDLRKRSHSDQDSLDNEHDDETEEEFLVEDDTPEELEQNDLRKRSHSLIPDDGHGGTRWSNIWNLFQRAVGLDRRMSVVYGHDAKRGLRVDKYTYGIDTGCVKGHELTALVIKWSKKKGRVTHKLVHVDCEE